MFREFLNLFWKLCYISKELKANKFNEKEPIIVSLPGYEKRKKTAVTWLRIRTNGTDAILLICRDLKFIC